MDYAYICRSGSNEELRYSIRSLVKNTTKPNIVIFGQTPSWYVGDKELIKEKGTKYGRARNNLAAITKSELIAEDFILMNDDFFVMQRTPVPPVWHGGYLVDKIHERKKKDPDAPYVSQLIETYKSLRTLGIDNPIDYELHTPMQMTKSGLASALKYPGLWRSLYGNMNSIGGEFHEDVKVYPQGFSIASHDWTKKSRYLSTMDAAFDQEVGHMIRTKFNKKTKYEK